MTCVYRPLFIVTVQQTGRYELRYFLLILISQHTVVLCGLLLMCVTVLVNCEQKVWFVHRVQ